MLSSVVLLCCLLPLCACTAECPTANGDPVLCAQCSDTHAAVRWNASSNRVKQPKIQYSCVNTNGSKLNVINSCYGGYDLGIETLVGIIGSGIVSRIHAIDVPFSTGVLCTFSGVYLDSNFRQNDLPTAACMIKNSTECEQDPGSCLLPATCINNHGECECRCNQEYENESCSGTSICKNGITCKDMKSSVVTSSVMITTQYTTPSTTPIPTYTSPQLNSLSESAVYPLSASTVRTHTLSTMSYITGPSKTTITTITTPSPTSSLLIATSDIGTHTSSTMSYITGPSKTTITTITTPSPTSSLLIATSDIGTHTLSTMSYITGPSKTTITTITTPSPTSSLLIATSDIDAEEDKLTTVLSITGILLTVTGLLSVIVCVALVATKLRGEKTTQTVYPMLMLTEKVDLSYEPIIIDAEYIIPESPCTVLHELEPEIANAGKHSLYGSSLIFDFESVLSLEQDLTEHPSFTETHPSDNNNEANDAVSPNVAEYVPSSSPKEMGDDPTTPQYKVKGTYIPQSDYILSDFTEGTPNDEPVLNAAMIFDDDDDMDESLAGANETTEELRTALTEIGDSPSLLDKHRAVVSDYIQTDSGLGLFSDDSGVAMTMISYEDTDSENEVPDSITSDYIQTDSGLGLFSDDSGVAMTMISYESTASTDETEEELGTEHSNHYNFKECLMSHAEYILHDNASVLWECETLDDAALSD